MYPRPKHLIAATPLVAIWFLVTVLVGPPGTPGLDSSTHTLGSHNQDEPPEPVMRPSSVGANAGWYEVGANSATGGGISNNNSESVLPSLAVAPAGTPYLAWEDYGAGDGEIYVRRWNGSSWEEVGGWSAFGGGISNTPGQSGGPSMSVAPDGTPYVAWYDRTSGDAEIYIRRWNGSSWAEVGTGSASGGGISNNSGGSYLGAVAITPNGTPYVAWYDYSTGRTQVYVRRWNGSNWVEVGAESASGGGISNSATWVYDPTMVIAPDGTPYAAWTQDVGSQSEIYVRRWNGTLWTEVGTGAASGGGISNSSGRSVTPALAVATDGKLFVAWQDYSPGAPEIYVRRWSGSAWEEVGTGSAGGGGISDNGAWSHEPSVSITPDGAPLVAWRDSSGGDYEIYIRRWNGSAWVENGVGSATGGGVSDNSGDSMGAVMTTTPGGVRYLAWHDSSAGDSEIYLRQGANLVPRGLEVTQAIQTITNSVTLIAGKRTFARLYVEADGLLLAGVSARLSGSREGLSLGDSLLPGNPGAVITATAAPDRGDLGHSFYFELPPTWLTGTLQLSAEVNPAHTIAETEYQDNVLSATVSYEPATPFSVTVIGIVYAQNNITYTPAITDYALLASWFRTAYPVAELNLVTATLEITGGLPRASEVNRRLATMYSLDTGKADQCPGARYYGLVSDGGGFMRGRALGIPGCIASGPTGTNTWGWDEDGSYGDWYAAHELGHTLGRRHTACRGDEGGPDPDYPYVGGRIGGLAYGFNVETLAIYTPTLWVDVMSYCDYQWISDYTYEGIHSQLITETAKATTEYPNTSLSQDGYLLVLGEMNLDQGTAQLNTLYHLPDLVPSSRPVTSTTSLRLLDADGGTLAYYPFDPRPDTEPQPGEDLNASVYEIVPFLESTARIALYEGTDTRAWVDVSAAPPTVTLLYPNGGEVLGDLATVTWEGHDADDDPIIYSLLYSADDGATWTTIAAEIAVPRYTVRTGELPGSQAGRMRVLASDGVRTAWDDSDGSLTVPVKAPVVEIHSPRTGASYLDEQTVVFIGEALDREDGRLVGPSLVWSSSLDGNLGSGRSLALSSLTVGEHTITLRATDSDGLGGAAAVIVQITPGPYRLFLPVVTRSE